MKRPPGIWILLSAGVLWLSLQDVYGIRATSLIFGKSTTTTTTPGPVPNVTDGIEAEVVTEPSAESNGKNASKPALTGIPQIDYIHDPNLPKELNGYNLSEYPFYERVPDPDEIDFKCDGLHDGFYASITYKCQVYHHCLFGTRYDFLCANYTAFDQKTFICQFVSDVDCVGSKKFWHRNDALYKATTTTTLKPLTIYTTAPPISPAIQGKVNPRAGGKRRRPLLRRPQYDYYDDYADYDNDYYEDRPRANRRRRPRPRPRPVYEDEYDEEYEDEEYERRNRRPYNRRGSSGRRNKNRNKNRELEDDYTEKPKERRKNNDREEDNYRQNERRKPNRDSVKDEDRFSEKTKPQRYNNDDERSRKPSEDFQEDKIEKRNQNHEDDLEEDYDNRRPSKKSKRPSTEEDYDEIIRNRESSPRKKSEDPTEINAQGSKPLIVPTTGTIYDKPRVAPRIKPPVPKNEANKYAYKPIKATTATTLEDEEYYDDYEDELPTKPTRSRKPPSDPITPKSSEIKERKQNFFPSRNRMKVKNIEEETTTNKIKLDDEGSRINTSLEDEDDALTLSPKKGNRGKDRYRSRSNTKPKQSIPEEKETRIDEIVENSKTENLNRNAASKKYPDPEYYDDEIETNKEGTEKSTTEAPRKRWRPSEATTSTPKVNSRRVTTAPTEGRRERPDQIVRIVKRPFLPSRGGNPYVARGLQPVGFKAAKQEIDEPEIKENIEEKTRITTADRNSPQIDTKPRYKPGFEPSGFEVKENPRPTIESSIREEYPRNSVKSKFSEPISDDDDDFKPINRPSRPPGDGNIAYGGPRTTQKPKVPDRNPLDINEQEYDVTLNDALYPTLPNLPLRANFPTGFSPANDYTFSAFQRPRYVIEPLLSSANTDYVYQPRQPAVGQQYEHPPQSYSSRGEFLPNSNNYQRIVGGNTKRGVVHAQTQPYY